MLQIIFNEISAAEISQLDTIEQLDLLTQFKVTPADLENFDSERFGRLESGGKALYRYRSRDYRIYFEVTNEESVLVHRVLHANTFQDFLFRSQLPGREDEDEVLAKSKSFWKLIEEGKNARRIP